MASATHAEPAPATNAHAQAPAHQPATTAIAIPDDGPQPGHSSACGVAGTAAPASAHRLDLADLGETTSVANVDVHLIAQPWIGCWDEPFWPPGTRRALLQVYRI